MNGAATGSNNGSSWTDAYTDLQSAIDAAASGDEVWVAQGTYTPTSWPNGGSGIREKHFSLKDGIAVYGGFSGDETDRGSRDPATNVTILSGDIGTVGDDSDNCYHVFYHPGSFPAPCVDDTAVLDGFTITGGNANGSDPHPVAGDVLSLRFSSEGRWMVEIE